MSEPPGAATAESSIPDVSRYSFDQLDALVRVTTIQAWVGLVTLLAVCASSVVFAALYQVPTKINGDGILLIDHDTLSQVRAQAQGRLISLHVKLGVEVNPGDLIGEISQDDLKDLIREGATRLANLKRDDEELARFERKEKETQDAAVDRLRRTILLAKEDSRDSEKIAERVVLSSDRLRIDHHLGDLDLLTAREKLYKIRDDLNEDQARLAELDLTSVRSENARQRAQLERRLKIRELETKLDLDREKLTRTSRIISHTRGQVAQLLSAPDELIREGSPVVLLHASKEQGAIDDTGSPYDSIIFVPAGEGKKIELRDPVEVTPATVKREEHGFIRGEVVAISELPATKLAIEAALQHSELAETFLKRYQPGVLLRLHIKLDRKDASDTAPTNGSGAETGNPFRWSSSSGSKQRLKTGTMCQAAIVVDTRPGPTVDEEAQGFGLAPVGISCPRFLKVTGSPKPGRSLGDRTDGSTSRPNDSGRLPCEEPMALLQFSPGDVKLSQHDAFIILRFFFGDPGIPPGQMAVEDRTFAQALLVEAIDKSYDEGFVELLFKHFFMKIPTSFKDIEDTVKAFAKAALKHWFKHATRQDLQNPKIYENVRLTLARNFRSVWQIRRDTGEPVSY
jgi:HlyD family secretion protein